MGQYKVDEDQPRVPRPATTNPSSMSGLSLAGRPMNKSPSVLPLDALLVHECGNVVLDMLHVLVDC